jgi:hypothetical protein
MSFDEPRRRPQRIVTVMQLNVEPVNLGQEATNHSGIKDGFTWQ